MNSVNGDGPTDAINQRQLATLERFVVRARRVEEHSLASDKDKLLTWSKGTIKVRPGPPPTIRWELPDEESLDSLAARCRPFVLKGDSVYHGKVTDALGYFVRGSDETLVRQLQHVKTAWRKVDPATKEVLGYESRTGQMDGTLGEFVPDKTLAYAWLYGDLVHADADIEQRARGHDIDSRFKGGVVLVAGIAMRVIMTLNLLRAARDRQAVMMDNHSFSMRVNARNIVELPIAGVAVGPADTPAIELEAALRVVDDD